MNTSSLQSTPTSPYVSSIESAPRSNQKVQLTVREKRRLIVFLKGMQAFTKA